MCHPKNLCQSRIILNHYKPILSSFESVLAPIFKISLGFFFHFGLIFWIIESLTQKMIDDSQIKSGYGLRILQFCRFGNSVIV